MLQRAPNQKLRSFLPPHIAERLPGVLLCTCIAVVAIVAQHFEEAAFEHPYVEALVIAILIGMGVRSFWTPGEQWRAGIGFSAKQLLEVAVVLLGASISFAAILASGLFLVVAVMATVALALVSSYGLGRLLGLSPRLSILIACGNSICGNSAIAAVAPVIGADSDDIASSISFTAILGVVVVLGLPLLIPLLSLSPKQYGVLAGLTVYAVPQVLAATVPAGLLSTQIGTLVKLMRVLMLGPVVLALSIAVRRMSGEAASAKRGRFDVLKLVPWFITGFIGLAVCRSIGLIPDAMIAPLTKIAVILTIISMAALGLGVDLRAISRVGPKVTAAVTLSLIGLLIVSLGLIRALGIR